MPADGMTKPRWNGWGADSSQRRFQPAEMAHLTPSDVSKLKLKWAFELPAGRATVAQPTVMGGRIFIGTQAGKVYSLEPTAGRAQKCTAQSTPAALAREYNKLAVCPCPRVLL
jgi:outer membrane protein assembly factor BamB